MDSSVFSILLRLLEQACLFIVVFYLLYLVELYRHMLDRKFTVVDQVVIAVVFGVLAIYGTYAGVPTHGAIANVRNIAPMLAGFVGGIWPGLGAGLIGGVHRYFMGGFTALPCGLGTVLSGLGAGIMLVLLKGNLGEWKPALYAVLMQCADMGLILLMARPFDEALRVVSVMALPMIAADALGVAAFAFMLKKIRTVG